MNVAQFISYYPKYVYLDDLLTLTGSKKINFFIDLKGCMQALYQEWAVKYVISQSLKARYVDTTLFFSFLEFIAWHKNYAKKREIDINFVFFLESGNSIYHESIYKDYKKDRRSTDMFGLSEAHKELLFNILNKNYTVIQKMGNRIPNVKVIRLNYLEADFIPWHLIKNVLKTDGETNIIYSVDKDLLQCLEFDNTFQFYRTWKKAGIISKTNIYEHFLKEDRDWDPRWFSLILAIMGDASDGFTGVYGIKEKKILKVFPWVMKSCQSMKEVYNRIKKKQTIFQPIARTNNKLIEDKIILSEDIIIRNLKLISFELLSDCLEDGYPTSMIKNKEEILSIINSEKKITNPVIFLDAIERSGLSNVLTDNSINNLFL